MVVGELSFLCFKYPLAPLIGGKYSRIEVVISIKENNSIFVGVFVEMKIEDWYADCTLFFGMHNHSIYFLIFMLSL